MDEFARRPAADRADLFRTVAAQRGFNPAIVEKDFWACWTLKHLFALETPPAGLLFKGGTSLSKVFKVIERLSEDIDLSFDRGGLGFGGDKDPFSATGRKQRERSLKALADTCRNVIQARFLPQLAAVFSTHLEQAVGQGWRLELANDDPDQQTLVFGYPASLGTRPADEPAYIRPAIRLELGARSEHWPVIDATVASFVAEDFPALFRAPVAPVRVLSAERTFWEKATALHAWHRAPSGKAMGHRFSRHFYDVVRMYEDELGRKAIRDTGLLQRVIKHKMVFFPSRWAQYEEARPGTLRLVPPYSRLAELRADYQSMREMIFGEAPTFDHLIAVLTEIEAAVNATAHS
ncbi:MAG: nucleotidyl transferase AbiEii/AbiGii toxin family protein [Planctomycetes bacterium]|nr:nucleotidyl transferase AbiEii/AbiGii toxin family protein [Planctomycetota bacterium]